MSSTPVRRRLPGVVLVLAGLALSLRPSPLAAQSFAAGLGAAVYADSGTHTDVNGFANWGGDAYVEVVLAKSTSFLTVLQGRYSRFQLPGTQANAPNVLVNAGIARVSYRWRDDWFQSGFFGGGGVFCTSPKSPAPGQVAVDSSETAAAATIGVETLFRVTRELDFRLEFGGDYIFTTPYHRPFFIGGGLSYRF